MSRKRRKCEDEETNYWLSYSDMMAALLLTFVLIISFTMLQAKKQYDQKQRELEQKQAQMEQQQKTEREQAELVKRQQEMMEKQQEQIEQLVGVKGDIIKALKDEFLDSNLSVFVDATTGAITFDSNVLFDYNKFNLKKSGKKFLNKFLPRYFRVLLNSKYREYVSQIIVEGHTDTNGEYLFNLELSQKRAFEVVKYCFSEETLDFTQEEINVLKKIVTANGRSFSEPIQNEKGEVDMDASRRVEIKFRLKDEEMIGELKNILN